MAEETFYLYPGGLFTHREPHLVTTVLGSCISVCLWDARAGIGGINHFLLPFWNGEGLPMPKYGNIAIPKLLEKMCELGGRPEKMVAKLFGGASMWSSGDGLLAVGERNIALARHLLNDMGIPLIASDTGGTDGRKIIFNTGNGQVHLRRHRGVRVQSAV
jgi:chemotaxis protein CheD